jgi:hypothetical protein
MLEFRPEAVAVQDPPSLADAIRGGADLIFDATISKGGESCRLDAVERIAEGNIFNRNFRSVDGKRAKPNSPSRRAANGV